ncbi:MAG: hypothetical protein WBQ53_01750 [Methylocystis sp.]
MSKTGPRPETPSGSTRPLILYWTLAYSLRTWKLGLETAESYDTPGACRITLSIGVLSPCGRVSISSRLMVKDEAPILGMSSSRA